MLFFILLIVLFMVIEQLIEFSSNKFSKFLYVLLLPNFLKRINPINMNIININKEKNNIKTLNFFL